jgi:hypothetical protein
LTTIGVFHADEEELEGRRLVTRHPALSVFGWMRGEGFENMFKERRNR